MILKFDGAFGTMAQKKGLKIGELPELLNINSPDIVKEIHKEYIDSGANVITLNTFGANRYKLKNSNYSVTDVISAAVNLTKEFKNVKKALDIGPIGQLLKPVGTLSFNEAYDIFKEMIDAAKNDCDIILFETMTDILELKAGILACKENCSLPVYVSMTFDENKRTLTGTDVLTYVNIVSSLNVDALGVNCSLGPDKLYDIVKEIKEYSNIPVIVQANAGVPKIIDGKTVFDFDKDMYADYVLKYLELGIEIIGGCCGTTPSHIKEISDRFTDFDISKHNDLSKDKKIYNKTILSSGTKSVYIGNGPIVCGERINPTGRKKLKQDILDENYDSLIKEAIIQVQAKADILDVNVGVPTIDEPKVLKHVIGKIQEVVNLPLQIDSSNSLALEQSLREYNGIPLINSICGKQKVMDEVFPIIKKYGACTIALALDESGIPNSCEGRMAIVDKILDEAKKYDIPSNKIVFDALVLTSSAQQEEVIETIKTIRCLKERGLKTVLGVSNVSFGLPNRPLLNRVFLASNLANGLDIAIMNPLDKDMMDTIDAFKVLYNYDSGSKNYINNQSNIIQEQKDVKIDLYNAIILGLKEEAILLAKEELKIKKPLDIVNDTLIPSLNDVGDKFAKGILFLPQLIQSAEVVKSIFEEIKKNIKDDNTIKKGPIIMATVYGDVHDIGKNIVITILESYGYEVIDLGKDTPIDLVVDSFYKYKPKAIGLSALMTTTVISMQETIAKLKNIEGMCPIFVGGAVLTSDIADKINADYYTKDALSFVEKLNFLNI